MNKNEPQIVRIKNSDKVFLAKSIFIIALPFILLQGVYAQDIANMTKEQFDSIPYIGKSYRMIISKSRCDFPHKHEWRGLATGTGKGASRIGTIVEVLKEYNEYFFVKTLRGGFGWIRKDCLKKPSNSNRRFCLEFTIGDSLGRGILASSVHVSSDVKGNIYILEVTSELKYRLHKYDAHGNFVRFIPIPLQPRKGREIKHWVKDWSWVIRETAFMKVTGMGTIFILTKEGIGEFSQDGEKLLEIKQNSNYPIILDISENEDIYVLEYCKIGRHANERQDIRIKIFSREGKFIDSLIIENLQNPTDLKVRNGKIYVVGERIKPFEHFSLRHNGDSAFEKEMDNYTLNVIEDGLKNYSKNVVRIYSFNKEFVREISIKNMFKKVEDLAPYEAKFFKGYGIGDDFRIRWANIAVGRFGNIYIFISVVSEDCSASYIMEYDSLGHFKKKLPYSREGCAYGGSWRSPAYWPNQRDLEIYIDNSILFTSGGWIYRLKDDSLFRAVKHTPGKEYFINPTAVAIDGKGNILVSDIRLNELKKFEPNGCLLWSVGGFGREEGKFSYIGDLCVDKLNNVYVADNNNGRVQKFDKDGNFILSFKLPKLHRAVSGALFDVYIGEDGNIYTKGRIQVFTPDGEFIKESKFRPSIRPADISDRISPCVTFDKYGNIWKFVVPGRPGLIPIKIYVFDELGEILDVYTAENFDKPPRIISDIEFDKDGNLWITDPGAYQVKKYVIK
ncbi:hypothetical protein KAW65_06630 [candidate division WOR-3 bacterium]|nr:hypothetical protein [candidate division WOR-3 bacterium]